MDVDTFSKLPVFWKTIITLGFIFLIIIFVLIIVLIFVTYLGPKVDIETNLDEYKDFLEDFDKEQNIKIIYPKLPVIKDLNGKPLKDLLDIF